MNIPKFIVMVGLPASGKSTKAKEISATENAIILSSDELRVELYGDVNHQDDNDKLFIELYRRAKEHLKNENSVILDATNTSDKRRKSLVNDFNKYRCEVYYINIGINECIKRDKTREKSVGFRVINRMYKMMTIPTYTEGWDEIYIISDQTKTIVNLRSEFEELIQNPLNTHEQILGELSAWGHCFKDIYNLPQDSKWHNLSVSRHTYEVWKYIIKNYQGEDRLIMLCVALLHDTGKAFCKNFKEGSRHANFISHENVSAQLTCSFLLWLGYDKQFILDVCELVQLHMRLLGISIDDNGEKARNKLMNNIGVEKFKKLKFFREADEQAK